jgi:hypothetical protein
MLVASELLACGSALKSDPAAKMPCCWFVCINCLVPVPIGTPVDLTNLAIIQRDRCGEEGSRVNAGPQTSARKGQTAPALNAFGMCSE